MGIKSYTLGVWFFFFKETNMNIYHYCTKHYHRKYYNSSYNKYF